jgi:hypothetical protein
MPGDGEHLARRFCVARLAVERKHHALQTPAETRQQQHGEQQPVLHAHNAPLLRAERLWVRRKLEAQALRVKACRHWRTVSMSTLHASSGSVSMSGSMARLAASSCGGGTAASEGATHGGQRCACLIRRCVVRVVLVFPPRHAEALCESTRREASEGCQRSCKGTVLAPGRSFRRTGPPRC